jgi:hypothetical protein
MPMIDFLCDSCSYRFENFFHSDPPDQMPCPHIECAGGVAKRIYSLPGEYRPTNARRFEPIVIWVNNENPDQISIPGRSDEPVQDGYHAVEITDMRTADKYTRHMNNVALRDAINRRAAEKGYWDEITKERRDTIRARIGDNPKARALFEAVCKFVDQRRNRRYSKPLDPKGHFQVLAFDSSNRQGYADADTGWRERRY